MLGHIVAICPSESLLDVHCESTRSILPDSVRNDSLFVCALKDFVGKRALA